MPWNNSLKKNRTVNNKHYWTKRAKSAASAVFDFQHKCKKILGEDLGLLKGSFETAKIP